MKNKETCVALIRKSIKIYCTNISKQGIVTNKNVWKVIKPFPRNQGDINSGVIMLANGGYIKRMKKNYGKSLIITISVSLKTLAVGSRCI